MALANDYEIEDHVFTCGPCEFDVCGTPAVERQSNRTVFETGEDPDYTDWLPSNALISGPPLPGAVGDLIAGKDGDAGFYVVYDGRWRVVMRPKRCSGVLTVTVQRFTPDGLGSYTFTSSTEDYELTPATPYVGGWHEEAADSGFDTWVVLDSTWVPD